MPPFRTPSKHKWNEGQRIFLGVLLRFYENPIHELFNVWNRYHHSFLRSEGFDQGLPLARLYAQIHTMKTGGTGSLAWKKVMEMPLTQAREVYGDQKHQIETVAQNMGLVLRLKIHSEQGLNSTSQMTRNDLSVAHVGDWLVSSSSESEQDPDSPTDTRDRFRCLTPKDSFHQPPGSPRSSLSGSSNSDTSSISDKSSSIYPSPKLRIEWDIDGNLGRTRPPLLFRAFVDDHHFTARRYQGSSDPVPQPPSVTSENFKDEVKPHLKYDKTYKSPFMSFTQNPRVALNLIKNNTAGNLQLAIFNFNDIEEDARDRFGKNTGPHLVPDLCTRHELTHLPKGYKGVGEWLVWGNIECQPLAVLDQSEALQLCSTMKALTTINKRAGSAIGMHLQSVDGDALCLVARNLVVGFKIPGYEQDYHNLRFRVFLRAVRRAAKGGRRQQSRPSSPIRSSTRRTEHFPSPLERQIQFLDNYDYMEEDLQTETDDSDVVEWSDIEEPQDSTQSTQTSFNNDIEQTLPGIWKAASGADGQMRKIEGHVVIDAKADKQEFYEDMCDDALIDDGPEQAFKPSTTLEDLELAVDCSISVPDNDSDIVVISETKSPRDPTSLNASIHIQRPDATSDIKPQSQTQQIKQIQPPITTTPNATISSPFTSTGERTIIDLTDDNEVDNPVPNQDGSEEDVMIIATSRRGLNQHRPLSIRSKSASVIPWKVSKSTAPSGLKKKS